MGRPSKREGEWRACLGVCTHARACACVRHGECVREREAIREEEEEEGLVRTRETGEEWCRSLHRLRTSPRLCRH